MSTKKSAAATSSLVKRSSATADVITTHLCLIHTHTHTDD